MDDLLNSASNQNLPNNNQPNQNNSPVDGISSPFNPSPPSTPSVSSPTPGSSVPNDSDSKPSLGAPITTNSLKTKKSMLSIILSVLVLIILIGGITGVYYWQQGNVKTLNNKVSNLTFQNETYQKELSDYKAAAQSTTSSSTSSTSSSSSSSTPAAANGQYLFKVSQLGIELTVPATLADLTSQANSANTEVNLSTQTLTDLDSGCTANVSTGKALGDLTKGTGKFASSTNVTLVKQYTDYYIAYTSPASDCSTVTQVSDLVNTNITALKATFSSIQVVQ